MQKRKISQKIQYFRNKRKILAKKVRKFIKQDKILRIQESVSKRSLSASPINGLTQNINIDLRTTRRHQKFCEIFAFRENIFAFRIIAKEIFAKFRFLFTSFIKRCESLRKSLRNATESLRNVSLAGNPKRNANLQNVHWAPKTYFRI